MSPPLLEVRNLVKHFSVGKGFGRGSQTVHAVDDVSFSIARGEVLSLVGESGCGKSTIGRVILNLMVPTTGEILFEGRRIDTLRGEELRAIRRRIQAVFQDPFSSLNPRMTVGEIIGEPLLNFGLERRGPDLAKRVAHALDVVRLPRDAASRYPHEFSGGQRQRVGIARALVPGADLIVCDEAVSALDVSVKAQIVNLLSDLRAELGLALLFISHDLAVVEHLTDKVAVMYLGKLVEVAEKRDVFGTPSHPYTQALLSAVPVPDPSRKPERTILRGDVPSATEPPSGCRFHTRCPHAFELCTSKTPLLEYVSSRQKRACHLPTRISKLA